MTSNNDNGSLNAEAQKFSNINSHWHLSYLRLKKKNKILKQIKDITVIDDTYNANLTSSLAALDYLNAFSGDGRKIFVFGDMYELGPTSDKQHQKIGERCLELNLDGVFTIGEHTKHTNSIIKDGMMSKHFMNEKDLIEAYNKNLISGFALDVFENEPVKRKFLKKINKKMNCILTPHISGITHQSNIRVSDFIVDKVIDFFN